MTTTTINTIRNKPIKIIVCFKGLIWKKIHKHEHKKWKARKGIQQRDRDKSWEQDTRTCKRTGSATSLHGQHKLFCKLQGWQHWGNPSMDTLAVLLPVWQQRLLPSVESSRCYTRNTQKRICQPKFKKCSGVQVCKDESTSLWDRCDFTVNF
jgi:hypothetical protein